MSAKETIKRIVDSFNSKPHLKDKTREMGEGLMLGASLADDANELSKDVQAQVDQLVVEGDSSVEAAQARVDASGKAYTTLKKRLDEKEQETTAQFQQNQIEAYSDVDDIRVNFKRKYKAIGDGIFKTIHSALPEVTLEQVKALNPAATLENSFHWYVLQLAINEGVAFKLPSGTFVIDLTLIVNNFVDIKGNIGKTIIKNTGSSHGIAVKNGRPKIYGVSSQGNGANGSGFYLEKAVLMDYCRAYGNGRYGFEYGNSEHVVDSHVHKLVCDYNVMGGVYSKASGVSQKNNVTFDKVYCSRNGISPDTADALASPTSGHGFHIIGGISIAMKDCVTEFNTGAGLMLDKPTGYLLRGFTCSNLYAEKNKYTHLVVDTTQGVWSDIEITGSSYNNHDSYPSNSIQPTKGDVVVYGDVYTKNLDFNVGGINSGLNATKANKESEVTKAAVLQNGWTGTIYFTKNDLGQVFIQASITQGIKTKGTTICTMPVGYRPKATGITTTAYSSVNAEIYAGFVLKSDGGLIITSPASDSLTNIEIKFHIMFQS